jgi:FkbM family methyltransferase
MEITFEEYERIEPRCAVDHQGKKMVFSTPNSTALWRVKTLFTKEPGTLEWLNEIQAGEFLLDIGANVGMYTVWAAVLRGARVVAIEPESGNYALLNRNIRNNNIDHLVKAYCMALLDKEQLCDLNMHQTLPGGSNYAAGEALNFELQPMNPVFKQGCYARRLDDLVSAGMLPVPNYIKIDVDGFEYKVVKGAQMVIANPALRSLLIETNPALAEHREMINWLMSQGFSYSGEQVEKARRKEGEFKGMAEYVFRR